MDYYEGVVAEYLRANRAVFLNTECLIQIEAGDVPSKGASWFRGKQPVGIGGRLGFWSVGWGEWLGCGWLG
jgi:hypothetical protein